MAHNDTHDADDDSADARPAAPITSRFLFVDVAAQRAKQLRRGALPRLDRSAPAAGPHKLERVAMEEVRTGVIHYTLPTTHEGTPRNPKGVNGLLGALEGLAVSTGALLLLFVGFCLLFNLPKLRPSGRHSKVVRGLDELIGIPQTYLSPNAPHGPADQLRTPELLEKHARKSA